MDTTPNTNQKPEEAIDINDPLVMEQQIAELIDQNRKSDELSEISEPDGMMNLDESKVSLITPPRDSNQPPLVAKPNNQGGPGQPLGLEDLPEEDDNDNQPLLTQNQQQAYPQPQFPPQQQQRQPGQPGTPFGGPQGQPNQPGYPGYNNYNNRNLNQLPGQQGGQGFYPNPQRQQQPQVGYPPQNNFYQQNQGANFNRPPNNNMNNMNNPYQNFNNQQRMMQPNQQFNNTAGRPNFGNSAPNTRARFYDPTQRARGNGNNNQAATNISCLKLFGSCQQALCFPCNMCTGNMTKTIKTGSAGLLMCQGVFEKLLPPGFYYYNSCLYNIVEVSLLTKTIDIPSTNLLTNDNMEISIHACAAYRVVDPFRALFAVDNLEWVLQDIGRGVLKQIISCNRFQDILANHKEIAEEFRSQLETAMSPAGIVISFMDVTQMSIPTALERAMAVAAISQREAEAKKIIAESERQASKLLKKAGQVLSDSKNSVDLMFLKTLKEISERRNHTVIVPSQMIYIPRKFEQGAGEGEAELAQKAEEGS